jgi:hypothetical protein
MQLASCADISVGLPNLDRSVRCKPPVNHPAARLIWLKSSSVASHEKYLCNGFCTWIGDGWRFRDPCAKCRMPRFKVAFLQHSGEG